MYVICRILNCFSKPIPISLAIVVNFSKIIVLDCLIVTFFFVVLSIDIFSVFGYFSEKLKGAELEIAEPVSRIN